MKTGECDADELMGDITLYIYNYVYIIMFIYIYIYIYIYVYIYSIDGASANILSMKQAGRGF